MEYIIQDSTLQGIADAIRSKTGDTAPIQTDAFANAISLIQTGGGADDLAKQLIEGTVTEINDSSVEVISDYAFYYKTNVTSVSFPNAIDIKDKAFQYCSNIATVNFPKVTKVGANAFTECMNLSELYFPECTTIMGSAFTHCRKATKGIFPKLTTLGNVAAFASCWYLRVLDLGLCQSIGGTTCNMCYSLVAVLLRGESLCPLDDTSAFNNCYHFHGTVNATYNPDGLKDGYIYVPRSLVASYQAATKWSTFASQFRALEDYTVDGTITGELDPNKI